MPDDLPLVSCVMPTADRRKWVPQAIRYFQRQDYPHRELVILDDGREPVEDLIPDDPRIRYRRLGGRRTLGAKRNLCVAESRGDLILHWDDDDWMAPHRIRCQVEALLGAGAEVCGQPRMLFHELSTGRTWLFVYPDGWQRPWLAGGSLLYTKEFWSRSPFPDVQVGSDTAFVWSQRLDGAVALADCELYVAMIHRRNTSPKLVDDPSWTPWTGDIRRVVGEDLDFYRSLTGAEDPRPAVFPEASRTGARRRIGYILKRFSPLPETPVRREILALCGLGHEVFVYTPHFDRDPRVALPGSAGLTVREVDCERSLQPLADAVRHDDVEHLHGSLMLWAQLAAQSVAEALGIPFTITAYAGISVFTAGDDSTYGSLSRSPWCGGIVVEDPFMEQWLTSRCGVDPGRVVILPSSLDLRLFRLPSPRQADPGLRILAVARFVERKGLTCLIEAFQELSRGREDLELWLVGRGPQERELRRAAAGNPSIAFLGFLSEAQCRQLYARADVFCLPCVQLPDGDADGMPTAMLEAMAFELPVVTSDLLSLPHYVRDGREGLLAPPGDSAALAERLERLCRDPELRTALGRRGRERVEQLCDLDGNTGRLAELFAASRRREGQPGPAAELSGMIDVVIPHYDCADHLARCLESVAVQTYNFLRVTVVDDGSNERERAREIVAGFQGRLPVRFQAHATNRGAPAARNAGAKDAIGEYLFFLDADCFLYPEALQTLIETLIAEPSAAYAYCGFVWGDRVLAGEPFDGARLLSRNYVSTMSLIRRRAFPGFDESLRRLQDWDLWITMLRQGKAGAWSGEVLFETPMREGSISTGAYTWEEAAEVLRQKHGL
ncbi:MAG TPA: glycosyltransferase [Thermoanaerobaculia bacterium]|nr:glycosyltransferase [Thermoanaerobaculia bacterium]